jgi:hypothetical protein
MPRWKLSDLIVLVLVCGIGFAAYRLFWLLPPSLNTRFFLSSFLSLLATASLGSFYAYPRWRRACQGFATFAWLELVFVVWGGFWVRSPQDARQVVEGSQMGMVFGLLCAVLAWWLFEPPGSGPREAEGRQGLETRGNGTGDP